MNVNPYFKQLFVTFEFVDLTYCQAWLSHSFYFTNVEDSELFTEVGNMSALPFSYQ